MIFKSYKQGGDKDGGNQPRETFFSVMILKEKKKNSQCIFQVLLGERKSAVWLF